MEATFFSVFLTTIIITLLYLAYLSMKKPKNFPPGPVGIPFLGSMHYVTRYPHLGMKKLAKKYGNVFSVKFFHHDVVCVTGYEELRQIFVEKSKAFSDRPLVSINSLFKGPKLAGISESPYSPSWSANRRIYHQRMRRLGNKGVERIIQTEASCILEELQKASRQPYDPYDILSFAALNVVSCVLFGKRFEYDEERMIHLYKLNNEAFKLFSFSNWQLLLVSVYPKITKIWFPKPAQELFNYAEEFNIFCNEIIEELEKTFDPENPRNYVDYYLINMKQKAATNNKDNIYSKHELKTALQDLFQAGSETTATTLRWILLYLVGHQEMQQKIFDEIDEAIGPDKEPEYEDRLKIPFTEACIHEIIRHSVIGPTTLFHAALEDTKIQGYNIPKGTIIFPSQYSSNFQPDKWKNPNEFDPENFLDENGKFIEPDAFLLFGGGLRICLGMALAKQEIFLFTVAILQKFLIKPEKEGAKLDYEPVPGLIMVPKPFKVCFVERN